MEKSLIKSIAFLSAALLFSTCSFQEVENLEPTTWSPTIVSPLLDAQVTMLDVVAEASKNRQITTNDEGVMTFVYFEKGATPSIEEVSPLLDQDLSTSVATGLPTLGFTVPGTTIPFPSQNVDQTFNMENQGELKLIKLEGGSLQLTISSSFRHDFDLELEIPSFSQNGTSFKRNITLDYQGRLPVEETITIPDLSDYDINLDFGPGYNTIRYKLTGTVTTSGEPISGNENFSLNMKMNNLDWEYVEGYLGKLQDFADLQDTVLIELFRNRFDGDLYLSNPKINFTLSNSIGLPVAIYFDSVYAKANREQLILLNGPGVNALQPFDLPFPTKAQYDAGNGLQTDSAELNNNNSNIASVYNPAPRELKFVTRIETNRQGKTYDNFAYDTSRVYYDARTTIPLEGRVGIYGVQDTFKLDWPVEENIEYVEFYSESTNGFPMDVWLQFYFTDTRTNYGVVDSLFIDDPDSTYLIDGQLSNENTTFSIVPSAPIDASTGRVTDTAYALKVTRMTKARYNKIRDNANSVIMKAWFKSSNNGQSNVKIFNDYMTRFRLGIKAQISQEL